MPTTEVGIFPPHSYAVLFGVLPFSLDKTPSPGGEPLCQRLAAWCLGHSGVQALVSHKHSLKTSKMILERYQLEK